MEVPQNLQHQLNQFQQLQQQAQAVTVQKQTVELQIQEAERAIEELKKSESGADVFKTAGNLLIKVDRDETFSKLGEQIETLKLREKTIIRQDERLMKKLQEMQASIQESMNSAAPEN